MYREKFISVHIQLLQLYTIDKEETAADRKGERKDMYSINFFIGLNWP